MVELLEHIAVEQIKGENSPSSFEQIKRDAATLQISYKTRRGT